MHCCEQKWWCVNKPLYITSDSYRASFHLTMHRLHGCTCWLCGNGWTISRDFWPSSPCSSLWGEASTFLVKSSPAYHPCTMQRQEYISAMYQQWFPSCQLPLSLWPSWNQCENRPRGYSIVANITAPNAAVLYIPTACWAMATNGFGCMTTEQCGDNRLRLCMRRSLNWCLVFMWSLVDTVVSLCPQCVWGFVWQTALRKILPWTMWLCSKEHMFERKWNMLLYPRNINQHASIYACIYIYNFI